MNNRLNHVWFDNMIWFHVNIIIFQLFRIIIPLKTEAKKNFSALIMALLLYFTSGNEKCGITDIKAFREVL